MTSRLITAERLPGALPPILNDRYQLDGLLGAGGMGMVYRARDLLHERLGDPDPYVAIKLLREDFASCPDGGALLYSEYALTRHLAHPNVVRVYSFEHESVCQQCFFSMELIRGMPLDRLLCEQPQGLPWEEVQGLALAMLEALDHGHRRGVLHGDIKPSNVILCADGVRLFDFGLGQAIEGVLAGLPRLSRERLSAWTPGYAAPELLEGGPLSVATDVFAVACVIYELINGKQPYGRLTPQGLTELASKPRPERPAALPKQSWLVLRQALELDPAKRHIDAAELRHAFARAKPSSLRHWLGLRP